MIYQKGCTLFTHFDLSVLEAYCFIVIEEVKNYRKIVFTMSATWPSGTARRRQILRDGFDSRLEPIAFDICVTGGC